MPALFRAKNFGIFEIYGVSAQTKGFQPHEPVLHVTDKGGEGQVFVILCGRLLWRAPNSLCCF